jgi:hypothetical protein
MKEKLKRLKEAFKKWNREVFGIVDLNIEKTVKELNAWRIRLLMMFLTQINSALKNWLSSFGTRFTLKIVFSAKNPERSGYRKVILILDFFMLALKPGDVEIRLYL